VNPLPARQIHLDFHTSEHIPGVGSRFDARQFQRALQVGHVNLINIFAKGHHGWSYYPTKVGNVHPTLQIDLLGEQIEACHEIGVRAPIYFTVGWSVNDAEEHPDWCILNADGTIAARNVDPGARPDDPRPPTSWKFLCPSGDYQALILAQSQEICQRYDVDGFWYDICNTYPVCYCENCRRGMREQGADLDDAEAVFLYSVQKWKSFQAECVRLLHSYHPEASVYFNGTTKLNTPNRNVTYKTYEHNTQHDLEDLPTTWGGYDKLPVRAKLFANTGKPLVAMSGKFHTSWGEFGGFKHPDAIRYEAASMIAYGAACNFGDQLHPLGEMDMDTYRNIGAAFEYVEQIEEYGPGGQPFCTLGLWRTGAEADDEGTAHMLLEIQADFCVVDPEADLSSFETIVLTGAPGLSQVHAEKLTAYVERGGALLVLGESALDEDRTGFVLDVGATYLGRAEYDIDYTAAGEALGQDLVSSPFLNYNAALRVRPSEDAQVLGAIHEPYFSRTYARFCSHLNTPHRPEKAAHPAALRKGQVVFLPHRLGKIYFEHGARLHREFFANALRLIYTNPVIKTELPSAGRVSLLHQPDQGRYVAHLLYGPPLQRGRCLIVEDLVPLHDVPIELRVPQTISRAYLVPSKQPLVLHRTGDSVAVTVPEVRCHQVVVFEYDDSA
jgi:hypothetical protein